MRHPEGMCRLGKGAGGDERGRGHPAVGGVELGEAGGYRLGELLV